MRKVFVAIPAYDGRLCSATMHSLLFAMDDARNVGGLILDSQWVHSRCSDADIGQARNAFLGWFLASDCTDLLFLDSDIVFQRGAINQVVAHSSPFVGGMYRTKTADEKYAVLWQEKKAINVDEASGQPLIELDGIGFGFVRMTRDCVERLDKAATFHFMDPIRPDVRCPWVFEFAHENGQRFSEDYTACRRWRDIGGKVYADPALLIDHVGTRVYEGDPLRYLEEQTRQYMRAAA